MGKSRSGEAFKNALTQLKEVYGFDGGNLEREYYRLISKYEDATSAAADSSKSIQKLNTVAQDLFTEWEKELDEIKSADLRRRSSKQKNETKSRYKKLYNQLIVSESKMDPVLGKLKDQVLFLKHNLNASAIGGLKGEGKKIEADIEKLIKDMEQASQEADKLIKTL